MAAMPVPEAERKDYLLLELACSLYARDGPVREAVGLHFPSLISAVVAG